MPKVETVVPASPEEDLEITSEEEERQANGSQTQQADQERGRSTIQFPYLDLSEAVAIAIGIYEVGGNSCQMDQLAAHLQQKADAPKFRQKLGTSKMFGFITFGQGTVALTTLGKSVCDPQQAPAAKAEAFLKIPLYEKVYEQFKGGNLPPMAGLETAMETLGVAPKQKRNARLAFQRSANQAGYFNFGPTRLVKPSIKGSNGTPASTSDAITPPPAPDAGKQKIPEIDEGGGGGGGSLSPFIQGLIKILPPEKSPWPLEKRVKWLQTASNMLDLVYEGNDGSSVIEIKLKKESAQ